MRLPRRRTFWLSAATLLLAVVVCPWFVMPRGRISRENFERIQNGMSWEEVIAIIGKPPGRGKGLVNFMSATWHEGADYISVTFALPAADLDRPGEPIAVVGFGTVCDKTLHLATAWETVQWYAKKGARKIGIKWQ